MFHGLGFLIFDEPVIELIHAEHLFGDDDDFFVELVVLGDFSKEEVGYPDVLFAGASAHGWTG